MIITFSHRYTDRESKALFTIAIDELVLALIACTVHMRKKPELLVTGRRSRSRI